MTEDLHRTAVAAANEIAELSNRVAFDLAVGGPAVTPRKLEDLRRSEIQLRAYLARLKETLDHAAHHTPLLELADGGGRMNTYTATIAILVGLWVYGVEPRPDAWGIAIRVGTVILAGGILEGITALWGTRKR